ncbi:14845_t:CDS:2, partial [Gigaspora margarita]
MNFDHSYPYSLYSLEDGTKYVHFVENSCILIMQNYFKDKNLFFNPIISIKELFPILKSLKTNYEFQFRDLINWIKEEYKNKINLLEKIIKEINSKEIITGAKITEARVGKDMMRKNLFTINVEKINSDRLSLIRTKDQRTINFWKGLRKIDSHPIFPISEGDKIYIELHYSRYNKDRVMVDIYKYGRYRSTTDSVGVWYIATEAATKNINIGEKLEDDNMKLDNVNKEILFICTPNLPVFSFVQKTWKISFDDEVFDKLILDQTRKDLIKSLVKFNYNIKTDFISGKGNGCTFLLHSSPGVGKTLTAEAISEMLHRPLYYVTVGELETNAKDLEMNLKHIFEMALAWNAVILLDEADIFLERRSAHDIEYNTLALSEKKNDPITTEMLENILNVTNSKISENIVE